MNGRTDTETMAKSDSDVADSVQAWAADLAETAKAYKGASGQESLLLRSKMTGKAKQIISAVKEPGETCFEYSVHVSCSPPIPFSNLPLTPLRWPRWAPSGC
jgi:hypothetical protein